MPLTCQVVEPSKLAEVTGSEEHLQLPYCQQQRSFHTNSSPVAAHLLAANVQQLPHSPELQPSQQQHSRSRAVRDLQNGCQQGPLEPCCTCCHAR